MGNRIQSTSSTPAPELTLGDEANLENLTDNTKDLQIQMNGGYFDTDKSKGLSASEINAISFSLLGQQRDDIATIQNNVFRIASNNFQDSDSAAVFYELDTQVKLKILTATPTSDQFRNNLARFDVKKFVDVLEAGYETNTLDSDSVVQNVANLEDEIESRVLKEIHSKHPELKPLFEQTKIEE